MKILHVSWEYPPVVYGGLGRHVAELAHAQTLLGHDVMVVTQNPVHRNAVPEVANSPTPHPEWDDERVRVVREATALSERPNVDDLIAWVAHLDAELSVSAIAAAGDFRPDIVHSHDWVTAGAGAALQSAIDVPLVHTVHATEAGRHQGWLPHDLSRTIDGIEQFAAAEAARIIVCSQAMRAEVLDLFGQAPHRANGIAADRVDVVPNGIDLRDWTADEAAARRARQRWLAGAQGPLVVQTGRLAWEKGAHLLIDAVRDLRAELPGLRAVIAGQGPDEDDLREQVERKGLDDVIGFAGWCSEPDLAALMTAADAVVVPSYYEPFGLVAAEASALGTPVIAADVGGLGEVIVNERTGLTFPRGDHVALAEQIRRVAQDPDRSRRFAEAARRHMEADLTWPQIAERTDESYARALADGPRRPRGFAVETRAGYVFSTEFGESTSGSTSATGT